MVGIEDYKELSKTKENNQLLALVEECLNYAKDKKEELEKMTSGYLKKGDFANYELSKKMFSEKCDYIYETEYLLKELKKAENNPGMILSLIDEKECDCHK